MNTRTQLKYAKRIAQVNRNRVENGMEPLQLVWHKFRPACKMRVVGKDLKGFTRRFVIRQINIEDGYALTT